MSGGGLNESERREAAALRALPLPVVVIARDGMVRVWNAAAERVFAWTASEIVGQPLPFENLRGSLQHVFETGMGDAVEFQYQSPKSGLRHLAVIAEPELAPDGTVISVLTIMRDITEQKRSEADLRASEERLRLAADAARIGLWDWDIPANRVTWSDRIYGFHGIGPGDFDGTAQGFAKFVHPDDRAEVISRIRRALSGDEEYVAEFRSLWPDGTLRWISSRAGVLRNAAGEPVRMIGANIDVTDRRHSEEALRRANRELEEFAYVASHDLQEPLRMVNTYSELLMRRLGDPGREIRTCTDFIRTGVARMETLIYDLLLFSRTVHAEPAYEDLNLEEVLADVVKLMAPAMAEVDAKLHAHPLPLVRGDRVQLGQVLQNLFSNAIKYRRVDARLEIDVSAERLNGEWVVAVRDNGSGFRPEYSERIFGLFKRLHGRNIPGNGVGLGICQRIIERHRGRIWAESEGEGHGATFRFTLPAG